MSLAFALAACTDTQDFSPRPAAKSLVVTNESILVVGPPGYCVDTKSNKISSQSAFVLLASCATIQREALAPQPDFAGVIAVSLVSGSTPPIRSIAKALTTGRVEGSKLKETSESELEVSENILLFQDTATSWRAFVIVESRAVVTISLKETAHRMDLEKQKSILRQAALILLAANRTAQANS